VNNNCPDYHYHNCSGRETDCHICLVNDPAGELLYDPIMIGGLPHPLEEYANHLKKVTYKNNRSLREAKSKKKNTKRQQIKLGYAEEERVLERFKQAGFIITPTERSGAENHDNDLILELNGVHWRIEVKKRTTGNTLVVKSHEANPAYILISTLKDGTSYATIELSKLIGILNGFKE
jgi:hypothetical protein